MPALSEPGCEESMLTGGSGCHTAPSPILSFIYEVLR